MDDLQDTLDTLEKRTTAVAQTLNMPQKRQEIEQLEAAIQLPDFWQNEEKARETTMKLAHLKEEVEEIDHLAKEITEAQELLTMVEEDDEPMKQDLRTTVEKLKKGYALVEQKRLLNGPYDRSDAILSIHAGQGGTEACDWAAMLSRMYSRYFERKGWVAELVSESMGEEAGIKAVTYLVKGKLAYGLLKREAGTHRLVRLSPFNADSLRQTSFALVEVLPQMETTDEVEIRNEDLEWSFFRSGGKGGQNVNKVNTAVRLKHVPSGIVVESQSQRYQEQNRKIALSILTAKLWQEAETKKQQKVSALKGTKMASWGSQIRSYVLHPYQLVKDVRTQIETSDTSGVLDGDLDQFIEAQLRLPG